MQGMKPQKKKKSKWLLELRDRFAKEIDDIDDNRDTHTHTHILNVISNC